MHRTLTVLGLLGLLALPAGLPAQEDAGRPIGDVTVMGNLIHLELDTGVVEPAHLFDLDRRTLRFTPDADGYRVENAPVRWDDDFGAETTDETVTLRSFAFPFSGGRHQRFDLHTGALTFAHPEAGEPTDFDLERYVRLRTVGPTLVGEVSGIAAFLKPRLRGDTFVKETADRVVVTWVLSEPPGGIQSFTWEPTVNRIQAVLHRSGVIELSYDGVSARDALVGVYPMGGDAPGAGPGPSDLNLSALRPEDGAFASPFEGFHWSESPWSRDVACSVITALGDRFDFIASYSDFRVDDPEGGTPSAGPRGGNVTGIGREMREPADYCSQGQLQSMFAQPVSTAAVQQHERSPDGSMTEYDYAVSQIAHELGHRWAASADALVDGERIELGRTHWYAGLHFPAAFPYGRPYEADIMGGSTWQENPDGTYTQLDRDFYNPAKGWAWLSLYFMGLASPDEVEPFFFLQNLERTGRTDAQGRPIYTGDKVVITVEDVIAAMGPRLPRYEVAQKDFNTAIVVITEPGKEPTDVLLRNARNIAEKWVGYWETTTGGRSTMTVDPGR